LEGGVACGGQPVVFRPSLIPLASGIKIENVVSQANMSLMLCLCDVVPANRGVSVAITRRGDEGV